jgi:hypothetical protein
MHGPNELNILHAINLHTTSINLCLATSDPKFVVLTFHSQLLNSLIIDYSHSFHNLHTLFPQMANTTTMKLHPFEVHNVSV